jgi:peroxiredoxin (alkyl hydroperoxide reductase subunit C)
MRRGVKITPIIADLNKEVSAVFGMVHPGQSKTETVRAVFIIDPNQVIRLTSTTLSAMVGYGRDIV